MTDHDLLGIERALASEGGSFADKYRLMKSRLLNYEYEHWASGWPEGNNHGKSHILRVLSYLDLLLGPEPLKQVTSYELFLAMMSVLYHDIGILHARKDHADLSKMMLEEDRNNAYIVNSIDRKIIGAAVVSHSSSKDIALECNQFSATEIVAGHKARPAVVAALVRLADELDEDYRRGDPILQSRLKLPPESMFFWRFCQRVTGVHPDFIRKRIDFHLALEPEDTSTYGSVPGGGVRHFVVFVAEKLAKINRERVNVNRFLPPELQFSALLVDVKPLSNHPKWVAPRAFVFNDTTTSAMFLNSFPELLSEPANRTLVEILTLMRDGKLDKASDKLERLASVAPDLPASVRLYVHYERACILSLKAGSYPKGSSLREQSLDQAAQQIVEWFKLGDCGAFADTGRIASAEAHRLSKDLDLALVLTERRKMIPSAIRERVKAETKRPSKSDAVSEVPVRSSRSSFGCVSRGSLIETPAGLCPIEQIGIGDQLFSLGLEDSTGRVTAKVLAISASRSPTLLRINKSWHVTPSQPVRTPEGWIEAANLRKGISVTIKDGEQTPIVEIDILEGYFEVFDLTVDDPSHNYFAEGLLCHNKVPLPPGQNERTGGSSRKKR